MFAKNTGYKEQAYDALDDWDGVDEKIKQRWKKGFRLANIEYGDGKWFCLFVQDEHKKGEDVKNKLQNLLMLVL